MNIRQQVLLFGGAATLLVGIAGGIGAISAHQMSGTIHLATQAAQATSASQSADMMHDAIRGDAQRALLGAFKSNPQTVVDARTDVADHAQTLRRELARIGEFPIASDTRRALEAALPVADRYAATAERLIAAAATGKDAALAEEPALMADFAALEDQMEALTARIEAESSAHSEAAAVAVAQTQWMIVVAACASLVGLVLGALWLAGQLTRPIRQAVAAADRLAEGDLTHPINPLGNDESRQLLSAMAQMQRRMVDMVSVVKGNAEQVAAASAQIAQGNLDLSSRTEQQAGALQQTAATMDELGSTVRNNTDSARQANQLAQGASEVAVRGGDVVGQVVTTMNHINDSSRRIADITGVIDGIAFQTNILALNAAVEAARAGEQGRGFAVVAGEVRNLAQRSAEAAREIKSLIGRSVEQVEQGTQLVDQAGQTMTEIVGSIRRVTDIVGEISAASTEQSTGVQQVGDAVRQMDQATQQNAALVEESAAAAESLRNQANQLVQSVSVFRLSRQDGGTAPQRTAPEPTLAPAARPTTQPRPAAAVRPTPAAKPSGAAPAAKPVAAKPAPAVQATSEEWETF